MLASYSHKRSETVVILSIMHDQPDINSHMETKKPYTIFDYNSAKGVVDTFDQLVSSYTCARRTNRWPMLLFCFLLDTAGVNAFVAFNITNPDWKNHSGSRRLDKRRLFLLDVCEGLVQERVERRARKRHISRWPKVASAMSAL